MFWPLENTALVSVADYKVGLWNWETACNLRHKIPSRAFQKVPHEQGSEGWEENEASVGGGRRGVNGLK